MALTLYHDSYKHTGTAEARATIVLIHGWGMNSLVWDELIPFLISDYQICVIDLPGLGRSPMPNGEYTLDYLIEHVLAVAPQKAIWFGWSLGALLVQKIAHEYPERITQSFLLAATPKFIASSDWSFAMPEAVFDKFYQLLLEDWQGTVIRFLTLQCKGSESIKEDAKKLRESVFYYGLPAEKALREGLQILKDSDLRKELAEITQPCHFILGQFDALIPAQVDTDLKKVNPLAFIHTLAGASHVPHLSHPKQVFEIFLKAQTEPEVKN